MICTKLCTVIRYLATYTALIIKINNYKTNCNKMSAATVTLASYYYAFYWEQLLLVKKMNSHSLRSPACLILSAWLINKRPLMVNTLAQQQHKKVILPHESI